MMQSKLIREKFLQFFIERGHQLQPPVPMVGKEDPSLLFVNAGMNPFKDILLGNQPITTPRVVTVQPCLRVSGKHNDLEEVGVDTYHHTFFEMLGNWSFGDYFKEAAIAWAWELLTQVYGLSKERIYVTIFGGDLPDGLPKDHQAAAIWGQYLPAAHILSFAKEDNFWEMGAQGPCGPSAEIHLDIRSDADRQALPAAQLVNKGDPQVIEIWNLVFMQYNRQASGKLVELPHTHIDTGMGFERLAMVLQGKTSTYETDIFTPLIERLEQIAGKSYHQSASIAVAIRVIADHLRAVAFAIADGAAPAHVKAGYVIRRILRRAMRYGYSHLGIHKPFIYQLVEVLGAQMEGVYPNLVAQQLAIKRCIQAEETAFLKTLAAGLQRFYQLDLRKNALIAGHVAFELYDTYGFPLDLTLLMAKEQGVRVDEQGFQEALQAQKSRAQKDAAICLGDWQVVQTVAQPRFVGYDQWSVTTAVVQWRTITTKEGLAYQLVLAETPFYPAGGGQVSDTGIIQSGHHAIAVLDVQKEHGLILHTVGQRPNQQLVEARVDPTHRTLVAGNHTATHLLHAALQQLLGKHVVQKGSLVTPRLLRFDFADSPKLSTAQIEAVEALVNEKIRANIACVEQRVVPLEAAKAMGAQALFGEKYGSEVRVITFDPAYSIELCGGTHIPFTGQIGLFKIIHVTTIGSGIQRIEALTAGRAHQFVAQQSAVLTSIAGLLKQPKDLVQAVEKLIHEKKQLQKQCLAAQAQAIAQVTQQLPLDSVGEGYLLIQSVQLPHPHALQQIAWHYKARYQKIAIVLAASFQQQAHLVVLVSDASYPNAHALIEAIAPLIKGKGGACFVCNR